jgi:hypothetical protein
LRLRGLKKSRLFGEGVLRNPAPEIDAAGLSVNLMVERLLQRERLSKLFYISIS